LKTRGYLTFAVLLGLVWAPTAAFSEESTDENVQETTEERDWDWGGYVELSTSVGKGSFIADEYNARPSLSMSLSVRPRFVISKKHKLRLQARVDMAQTLVENADSTASQKNQFLLYDARLALYWNEFAKVESANLSWNTWGELFFPTSKFSQLQTKILGVRAGVSTQYKPLKWLTIGHTFYATKNFNQYNTYVLDQADFSSPIPARAGGAESVDTGLVALGISPSEWSVFNVLSVGTKFLDDFSAGMSWTMLNAFSYFDYPKDDLSSPNAIGGRGRSDVMYGNIEFGYKVTKNISLALGTTVTQSPKTSDNKSFRFPFWDTTNGAGNYQTFYFDVGGSF